MAAVPQNIIYQGTLRRSGAIFSGNATFVFRVTNQDGMVEYWNSGSTVVAVSAGLFRYPIGTPNSAVFEAINWSNVTPYVEVSVDGVTLSPREKLGAVPYALTVGAVPNDSLDSSSVTKQGNVFNLPDRLVQLDPLGRYPPLDGSLITNLGAAGDPSRVSKAGDTMTGDLFISGSSLTVNGPIVSTGAAGGLAFTGAGTRFMWIPSLAGIRAGNVTGTQWDDVGSYSAAFGQDNKASGYAAAVGGGTENTAGGNYAAIAGGYKGTAGSNGTVGGGYINTAGSFAFVGGGNTNSASGSAAAVAGGAGNVASGQEAAVPGGASNAASGDYSFAAGRRAKAAHPGSFVWGDSADADIYSSANDEVSFRAGGGVRFLTGTSTMSIVSSGNVGIGTTAPLSKLVVRGASKGMSLDPLDGSANAAGALGFNRNVGDSTTLDSSHFGFQVTNLDNVLQFGVYSGAGTPINEYALAIAPSGNVGIGTTSPGAALEVAGQVKITGGSPGSGKLLVSDAGGLASWQAPSAATESNTFTSSKTFTADVSVAGTLTATSMTADSLAAKKISEIRYCDQFPGADAGEKIANCMADLPSGGGIADARGIRGAQTIASAIAFPPAVTLLLGNVTLTASASILLNQGCNLIGMGMASPPQAQTIIQQAPGANIDLIANNPAIGVTSFLHSTRVEHIQLRGGSGNTGGSGLVMNTRTGEGFKIEHVMAAGFADSGIKILRGAYPLYMEDIHVFANGNYGIDINRTSGDYNQVVKLSLISGDNNGIALIRISKSGGINTPESYLIEGVKAEKSQSGKQNDVILLDTLNGSPVVISGVSAINTTAEPANSLVRIIGASAKVYWSGFASFNSGASRYDFWINDTVSGRDIPANNSAYVTGAIGAVNFNTLTTGGNVGIGTTAPASKLHMSSGTLTIDGTGAGIRFLDGNQGAGKLMVSDASGFASWQAPSAATESNTFTSSKTFTKDVGLATESGNVGIGTTNPQAKLDVSGILRVNDGAFPFVLGDVAGEMRLKANNGRFHFLNSADSYAPIKFNSFSAGSDSFAAANPPANGAIIEGNVGIGTTAPDRDLTISRNAGARLAIEGYGTGNDGAIFLVSARGTAASPTPVLSGDSLGAIAFAGQYATGANNYTGRAIIEGFATENFSGTNNGSRIAFVTTANGTTTALERMTIDQSGNVGIGTTSPEAPLEVAGQVKITGGSPGLNKVLTSDANGLASWQTASGESNTFTSSKTFTKDVGLATQSGSVGIGTTSPGSGGVPAMLDTRGYIYATENSDASVAIVLSRSGGPTGGAWNSPGNSWAMYRYGSSGSDRFNIGLAGVSELFTITTAGDVGIGTTGPGAKLAIETSDANTSVVVKGNNTGYGASIDFDGTGAGGRNFRIASPGSTAGSGASLASKFVILDQSAGSAPRLVMDSGGNVGIGTVFPATKLHMSSGTLTIDGSGAGVWLVDGNQGAGKVLTSDASGLGSWQAVSAAESNTFTSSKTFTKDVGLATESGSVGIGTTNPQAKLDVSGILRVNDGAFPFVLGDVAGQMRLKANNGRFHFLNSADSYAPIKFNSFSAGSDSFAAANPPANGAIIEGNVGIGTTNPATTLEVASTDQPIEMTRAVGGSSYGAYLLQRASDGTLASPTTLSSGNGMGGLDLWGYDGTIFREAAYMLGQVDGTPASNVMPSRLVFGTRPSGAGAAIAERMRIDSSGNVGIGTTSPGSKLHMSSGTLTIDGSGAGIRLVDGNQGAGKVLTSDASGLASWQTNAGESNTFTSSKTFTKDVGLATQSGSVGIGTTAPGAKLDVEGNATDVNIGQFYVAKTAGSGSADQGGEITLGGAFNGATTPMASIRGWKAVAGDTYATIGGYLAFMVRGDSSDNVERMRIDKSGKVGIGTMSPASKLHMSSGTLTLDGSGAGVRLVDGNQGSGKVLTSDANGLGSWQTDAGETNTFTSTKTFTKDVGLATQSGSVGIGTTALDSDVTGTIGNVKLSVVSNAASNYHQAWIGNVNNSEGSVVAGLKTRGTDTDANTIVADGDTLFRLEAYGADGSAFRRAAYIGFQADGTPGASDMPGRIVFATSADGGITTSERMRISNAGNVGIGTTAPASKLHMSSGTLTIDGSGAGVRLMDGNQGAGKVLTSDANGLANWQTAGESNTFTSSKTFTKDVGLATQSGSVGIGTTAPDSPLHVKTTASGVQRLLRLQNNNGSDGDGASLSFLAVTTELGRIDSVNDASGQASLRFLNFDGASTAERMRITTNGSVGIGTTSPASKFHMSSGTLTIDGNAATSLSANGAVLAAGTSGGVPANGAGTRFEWIPSSAAIRAGAVTGTQWDAASIGPKSVAWGLDSTASGRNAVVGGGEGNTASGAWATVAGGDFNTASGVTATVAGGDGNTASNTWATVGGGQTNTANNFGATVGGGNSNMASGGQSTVGGGNNNVASASNAAVGGGQQNTASAGSATVGGGIGNTASDLSATVGGGEGNTAGGYAATVGGGENNTASGNWSTVPGGSLNLAGAQFTFAAGRRAKATAQGSFVWADSQALDLMGNTTDQFLVRAQGGFLVNSSSVSFVNGTSTRAFISSDGSVGIGTTSPATKLHMSSGTLTIDGTSPGLTVGVSTFVVSAGTVSFGGLLSRVGNAAYGSLANTHVNLGAGGVTGISGLDVGYATVGGGQNNTAARDWTTISGGENNTASGSDSTVGGGDGNTASGGGSTVGGGITNTASANYSTVGGGTDNRASGGSSTVPGGFSNLASGQSAFAAGSRAKATAQGSFVWADSQALDLMGNTTDQFLVRAQGGFLVNSSSVSFVNGASTRAFISSDGNVGIGTTNPLYKLDVAGDINTTGEVRKNGTAYANPDYVFEPGYSLRTLAELGDFIRKNKHLPNMPSTEQVRKDGVKMFEQNRLVLEKLEEAYLYILQLERRMESLEKRAGPRSEGGR